MAARAVGGREPEAGRGGTELPPLFYGAAILTLLAVAVLVLLSGCSEDALQQLDGRARVAPDRIDFGVVAIGDTAQAEVAVRNIGDAPLSVTGVAVDGEVPADFVLPTLPSWAIRTGGVASLTFGFSPREEGPLDGVVVLHTDSVRQPRIRVSLAGEGRRPLVAANTSLAFGRIVLNTDKVLRITLVNSAPVSARVRVRGTTGEDANLFTVGQNLLANGGSPAVIVEPNGTALVEVRYFAAHLGPAHAVAHLAVEGAVEPDLFVDLSGEGFASDLVVFPTQLDFGAVSPGAASAAQLVTIRNEGNREVFLDEPILADASGVFRIDGATVDGVPSELAALAAGQEATIALSFRPTERLPYVGALQVRSNDPTNPRVEVSLRGRGGGADLLVLPDVLDFGRVATGMGVTQVFAISNVGTAEGGPLRVTGISYGAGDQGAFIPDASSLPAELEPGGTLISIPVTFRPWVEGPYTADLYIESNDGDEPRKRVRVSGEARTLPPCAYVAEPPVLDFGTLPRGASATLAVALRNVGGDDCVFSSVALGRGARSEFTLPDGPIGSATVRAGEALVVPVAVTGSVDAQLSTSLVFFVSDPATPQGSVPILATVAEGCLAAEPAALDFGLTRVSCPPSTRELSLYNRCGIEAHVDAPVLAAGSYTPGELALVGPQRPLTLLPGARTSLSLTYDPVDDGSDAAPLVLGNDVLGWPLTVAVHGAGSLRDERTEAFVQSQRQAVDVLFVVDNSGSMMEEQQAIGAAFEDFIQFAIAQDLDYHIGVTTTGITASGGGWASCPGGVDGGEAGRLFPADGSRPRWIDRSTLDAAEVFADNVQVGVCHWWEEGLEAAYLALAEPLVGSLDDATTALPADGNLGFYRPGARLSVIIVTDEDDHSDRTVDFYQTFFTSLKGPGRTEDVKVHGVLGNGCSTASGDGARYGDVIATTGGSTESICTSDWGAALARLAEASFNFRLAFSLSGLPIGAVSVEVDGAPATGWRYDPLANEVVFEEGSAPAPGATVAITYVPACGT